MINKINRNFSKSCYLKFIETSYRKISAIWKRNNSKSTFNTNPKFYTRRSESRYKSDWNIQQSQKKKKKQKKVQILSKKTLHGGVLLSKSKTPPWGVLLSKSKTPPLKFFTFFKLSKWYQIAQHVSDSVYEKLIIWIEI